VLEGTDAAAEYPDCRAIPGVVGTRMADLGCASVATIPLPDGGRILLDSAQRVPAGWVEHIRPFLSLSSLMAGPEWPLRGSVVAYVEVGCLLRTFEEAEEMLAAKELTIEDALPRIREALRATELFLVREEDDHLAVWSASDGPWSEPIPRIDPLVPGPDGLALDDRAMSRLTPELRVTSRAIAAGLAGEPGQALALLAGWSDGPALSTMSMTVAARTVSVLVAAAETRDLAVERRLAEERLRLAHLLHDDLTQTVTGAVLELEGMAARIQADPTAAIEKLDEAKRQIRASLAQLRSTLTELSASEEDVLPRVSTEQLGRSVATWIQERGLTDVAVTIDGEVAAAPPEIAEVAERVLHEGLTNAAKHAGGKDVGIEVRLEGDWLIVVVRDGGPGYTWRQEQAALQNDHVGLHLLRKRVDDVGGTLEVETGPGEGTRVIAQLPIHKDAR
jgi:signal transduction histidine kinase